jgi:hypothetical protein
MRTARETKMGILNYVWVAVLAIILAAFGKQEFTLRHENSQISAKLDAEIQCLKGSNCASRVAQESANGVALVAAARAQAATQAAAEKAQIAKQAADVIQSLQQTQAAVQRSLVTAQAKLAAAQAASTDCATWSKQKTQCAIR